MLFNFCDPRLRPEIQCSTVSTEGYEVTNLISNSDKGFLAYACIKPPINIDVTFVCNVCINHILIWPQVGSQKSSGFQLYAKTSNDTSVPYTLLATGFLDSPNAGVLFYPSNIDHETISTPPNFLKRYIKPSLSYSTTYISNLRICIYKTENSVPALGKIEVWGTVSPRCGKDTVASISTLWSKQQSIFAESVQKLETIDNPVSEENIVDNKEKLESTLNVPDCFLDAITYEIMTQPILLPSGKIIDQSTLLRHEETEALWGRRLTDPFTGLPFSEDRKPVIASALKIRIDKFLLENSNEEEIKKLPRVLGRTLDVTNKKVAEVPKYLLKRNVISKTLSNAKPKLHCSIVSTQASTKLCHKLPVAVMSQKRAVSAVTKPAKKRIIANSYTPICKSTEIEKKDNCTDIVDLTVDNGTDFDINTVVPNLKRFNSIPESDESNSTLTNCSCCSNSIFYRLPCKHVLCRKVLTSIENNQCSFCGIAYKNSEIQRIFE